MKLLGRKNSPAEARQIDGAGRECERDGECPREVAASAVVVRPASEITGGPLTLHHSTPLHQISYLTQDADIALHLRQRSSAVPEPRSAGVRSLSIQTPDLDSAPGPAFSPIPAEAPILCGAGTNATSPGDRADFY
ncbi:hypothetical protein EVAR_82043_1 [Eumeta japonica]|uniref:Uncharacterized protein n=1 Tax=Eumeta variegata TaxID=151549 RepID=A0A4C1XKK4_EUMVA|nr:hypothetical protein EVAR_82043_1 [Eumeta japonica]